MKTPSEAIKHLTFHLKGRNLQKVPALVGLTGIGKTAIVKQVAKNLDAELIYFNMAQLSEGEMALPVPVNSEVVTEGLVRYALNHKITLAISNPEKKFIIFVDEFTRGTVGVISEWMTIINERQLQGTHFSDNVRFVAAMNPTTEMYGFGDTEYASTELDDAHANRFTFIHVKASLVDWLEWATEQGGIHRAIIQFFSDTKNRSWFYGKEREGIRMRTPRAWESFSDSLKDLEEQDGNLKDINFITSLVEDALGNDIVPAFQDFLVNNFSTLTFEEVFYAKEKLSKSEVEAFGKLEENVKKTVMDGYVVALAEELPTLTPISLYNFVSLWETMKSLDNRYDVIREIAIRTVNKVEGQGDYHLKEIYNYKVDGVAIVAEFAKKQEGLSRKVRSRAKAKSVA